MSHEFGPIPGSDYEWHYTKCDGCGKSFYGYEDLNTAVIDGKDYCFDCAMEKGFAHRGRNRVYIDGDIYRIAHTLSSLYDGPGEYFTSLDWLKSQNIKVIYTRHYKADPQFMNMGYGLSGHIDEEHWSVHVKTDFREDCEYAFIFKPSDAELEKLRKYEKVVE